MAGSSSVALRPSGSGISAVAGIRNAVTRSGEQTMDSRPIRGDTDRFDGGSGFWRRVEDRPRSSVVGSILRTSTLTILSMHWPGRDRNTGGSKRRKDDPHIAVTARSVRSWTGEVPCSRPAARVRPCYRAGPRPAISGASSGAMCPPGPAARWGRTHWRVCAGLRKRADVRVSTSSLWRL
jgi:hypothetical protein